MNAKVLLDTCENIVRRQDMDRTLMLFFINTLRRTLCRDTYISRLTAYVENLVIDDGYVTVPNLKNPQVVEFEVDEIKARMLRLNTYEDAMVLFGDPNSIGTPTHYMILSGKIRLFPIPPEGVCNVFGEFWPDDLTDSIASSDEFTKEIPEVLAYLGCAEYFDMLSEPTKADYWRKKGMQLMTNYISQLKNQQTERMDITARDPFGNLGLTSSYKNENLGVTPYGQKFTTDDIQSNQWGQVVDEVDGGDW